MRKISSKILLFCFFSIVLSRSFLTDNRKEYAQIIIEKVEKFKFENDELPNNLSEVGLIEKMDNPAFYHKMNDTVYIIWYGIGVGDSFLYNSSTEKWTSE